MDLYFILFFFTKMPDYARAHQIQEPPLHSNWANSQENAWTLGRNYKYVEQNPHIGQLAKVTDVELLHYIMPALSPSLKMIALELFFFILQTLPIIPNLVFTSTISLPADYHSSETIEFCNFDRFQHQHFKCIIWKKHITFLPRALLVGRKNFWRKGMSAKKCLISGVSVNSSFMWFCA